MIRGLVLALVALSGGCFSKPGFGGGGDGGGDGSPGDGPLPTSFDTWKIPAPVGVGQGSSQDRMPTVSSNKLELFFVSTRSGKNRLYVAKRTAPDQAFGTQVLVTSNDESELDPTISPDGLDLYWVVVPYTIMHAHRSNWNEAFGATSPHTLPTVGPFDFYGGSNRMVAGSTSDPGDSESDIIELRNTGGAWQDGGPLSLATPAVGETAPTIRHDGLEIYFEKSVGSGNYETQVAIRANTEVPFESATQFRLQSMAVGDPELSHDGTELFYNAGSPSQLFVVHRDPKF